MRRKKYSAVIAAALTAGLLALPVAGAQAAGTKSGSLGCPAGRQAVVTATATWHVKLTVNGVTREKSVATGGATVTIAASGASGTYRAYTAGPSSQPSVSISCRV